MKTSPKCLALILFIPAAQFGAFSAHSQTCKGTLYLTIDTGSMAPANEIANVLSKHKVKATFFIANEKTTRGDMSLAPSWTPFWKRLADEGHAFGTHTWRHWYFRGDVGDDQVKYVPWGKKEGETLTQAQVCEELNKSDAALKAMTGRGVDPIWRAPGGRTTARTQSFAKQCGYAHVHWADAGFLGDELPSEQFPNKTLAANALNNLRDGDVMMMHLGIWSRKDPFWPMLDPLLTGLKSKGFCFDTIPNKMRAESNKTAPQVQQVR
jgi:peptidoglycan/xylan/chitin deacetylase (PgdA/CDA1 family)